MLISCYHLNSLSSNIYQTKFDEPNWVGDSPCQFADGSYIASDINPALIEYRNETYMAYIDNECSYLTVCKYDSDSDNWNTKQIVEVDNYLLRAGDVPTMCTHGADLIVACRAHSSNNLHLSRLRNGVWSGLSSIKDSNGIQIQSEQSPSLIEFEGILYMFYTAVPATGTAGILMWTKYNGERDTWQSPATITVRGSAASSDDGPASCSWNGSVHLYYKGAGTEKLYISLMSSQEVWSLDQSLQDYINHNNLVPKSPARPSVCLSGEGMMLVYQGIAKNQLWYLRYSNAARSWSEGAILPATTGPIPAVASLSPQAKTNKNWMSKIGRDQHLFDLNLPGTHDSGAIVGRSYATPYGTQMLSITKQLNCGIRLFDLRMRISPAQGGGYDFEVCHGDKGLIGQVNVFGPLFPIFDEMQAFLTLEPDVRQRETLIVSLKVDDWSTEIPDSSRTNAITALSNQIDKVFTQQQKYLLVNNADLSPRMASVAGKVVIINRTNYATDTLGYMFWDGNKNLWPENGSGPVGALAYVQDISNLTPIPLVDDPTKAKLDYFKQAITKSSDGGSDPRRILINFASANKYKVMGVWINKILLAMLGASSGSTRQVRFGWCYFDWTDLEIHTDKYGSLSVIDLIIDSNTTPPYQTYKEAFLVD